MKKFLNKKLFFLVGLLGSLQTGFAEMPVIDFSNLFQNTTTASNSITTAENAIDIAKYAKQNSLLPSSYLWDSSNSTITQLLQSTDTLSYFKNQSGGTQNYLALYQDTNFYRNSPCFSASGCSAQQWQTLMNAAITASEAQKRANDAELLGIDQQQNTLKTDSQNLVRLQGQAAAAQGQLQATQANNQLVSAEANQLLQIRALLVAQQNAQATRAAAVANKEAIQAAADEKFRAGSFKPSPVVNW